MVGAVWRWGSGVPPACDLIPELPTTTNLSKYSENFGPTMMLQKRAMAISVSKNIYRLAPTAAIVSFGELVIVGHCRSLCCAVCGPLLSFLTSPAAFSHKHALPLPHTHLEPPPPPLDESRPWVPSGDPPCGQPFQRRCHDGRCDPHAGSVAPVGAGRQVERRGRPKVGFRHITRRFRNFT